MHTSNFMQWRIFRAHRRAKTVTKKLRGRVRSVFVKRGLRIKAMKAGISKKESAEGGSGISGKSFDARLQSLNDKLDDLAIKLLDLLDDLPIRVTSFLIGLPRRIFLPTLPCQSA